MTKLTAYMKKRREEVQKKAEEKRQAERAELIGRACKAIKTKAPNTTAGEIAILERYLEALQKLKPELESDYGDIAPREIWPVDTEISMTVSELVQLRIMQANPQQLTP
jgi:hypothetical protein